LLDVNKPCLWS